MKLNKDISAISYLIQKRIPFTRNPTHIFIDENTVGEDHVKWLKGFEQQSWEPVIDKQRSKKGTGQRPYVPKEKKLLRPPVDVEAIKAAAKKIDKKLEFHERPPAQYSNKTYEV